MCEFGFVFSHISSWGSFGWKNGDFICAWCHLATSCIRGSPHQTCFLSQRDLAFCLTTPLHRRNNVWAREPQKSSEKWSKIRSYRDLEVCAGRTRDRKRTKMNQLHIWMWRFGYCMVFFMLKNIVWYSMVHGPELHWYCRSDPECMTWRWCWTDVSENRKNCCCAWYVEAHLVKRTSDEDINGVHGTLNQIVLHWMVLQNLVSASSVLSIIEEWIPLC